mgnify:CR=1 FL=1
MSVLLNLISRKVITFWRIPILTNCRFRLDKKRKNTISQMWLRSVFKMRMSILNTATTEQIGYSILSFFVYDEIYKSGFKVFFFFITIPIPIASIINGITNTVIINVAFWLNAGTTAFSVFNLFALIDILLFCSAR